MHCHPVNQSPPRASKAASKSYCVLIRVAIHFKVSKQCGGLSESWRGPWRSFEAVELATLEWVDWFNHRRLLEPIGNIPPAEAEDRYYAGLEQTHMMAA